MYISYTFIIFLLLLICKKDESRTRSLEAAMMWCDGKNYKIVIQSHFLLWLSGLVNYNVKRSGAYGRREFELHPSPIKLNYGLSELPCFVEKSPRREELKWSRVMNHVASWGQVGVHNTDDLSHCFFLQILTFLCTTSCLNEYGTHFYIIFISPKHNS